MFTPQYIFGEGKTAIQAEADFEMKKQEWMDEHPDTYLSHKTIFNKFGLHQVVQHVTLPSEKDAVESVITKKVKRKGF